MDGDLNDLAGLFQEEADVAALSALWSSLSPPIGLLCWQFLGTSVRDSIDC